jgi:hypothetical protein
MGNYTYALNAAYIKKQPTVYSPAMHHMHMMTGNNIATMLKWQKTIWLLSSYIHWKAKYPSPKHIRGGSMLLIQQAV